MLHRGFSLLTLALIFHENFALPLNQLPYLLFIGLIIVGFSFVLVYFAIKKIGSTRTGSLFSLASLFGAIFAYIILGEAFTITQLFFGFLMLLESMSSTKMKILAYHDSIARSRALYFPDKMMFYKKKKKNYKFEPLINKKFYYFKI